MAITGRSSTRRDGRCHRISARTRRASRSPVLDLKENGLAPGWDSDGFRNHAFSHVRPLMSSQRAEHLRSIPVQLATCRIAEGSDRDVRKAPGEVRRSLGLPASAGVPVPRVLEVGNAVRLAARRRTHSQDSPIRACDRGCGGALLDPHVRGSAQSDLARPCLLSAPTANAVLRVGTPRSAALQPRCRLCWGLGYESQMRNYKGPYWARVPNYVTTEIDREDRHRNNWHNGRPKDGPCRCRDRRRKCVTPLIVSRFPVSDANEEAKGRKNVKKS